jgi:glycerate 2-kinase
MRSPIYTTLCFFSQALESALPQPPNPADITRLLAELYRVATAAVDPGPALRRRLEAAGRPSRPPRVLALGKAALPMARAAVETLAAWRLEPAGGLVVAPASGAPPHSRLRLVVGDHPEPGPGSLAAADAVASAAQGLGEGDEVWVLLSGGTTSLIGAPEPGLTPADLTAIYGHLLGSGLDIAAMNRIRKRFARWGGGKLARALAPARIRVYVVSDVIGDDLAAIGSGPCVADPATAGEIRAELDVARLWDRLPDAARRLLAAAEAGEMPETPKPGHRTFARVTHELVASNRLALEAAAERAAELGLTPSIADAPLAGEASVVGADLAATLVQDCDRREVPQPKSGAGSRCFIWGGETTVTLGPSPGVGGRCQELALAAARVLAGRDCPALLAAGTDGRDGPTDAAGAIVDGSTWAAIAAGGRDPERDLVRHDAYAALDAAGALLRPGLTGTNVMDIVIGVSS